MVRRDDKRQQREIKRQVKKAGNKHRRRALKDELRKHPEEAAHSEQDFGRHSSAPLNGQDDDATRRRSVS
jgi:hypothetical protein